MIDADTVSLVIANIPNFVGLVLAVWVLDRRLTSLEGLLSRVLDKCLDHSHDHRG